MSEISGTHINKDGNLGVSALQAGLAPCTACGTLHKWPTKSSCRRCGGVVRSRKPFSLQRTWAFLLLGIMAYIPANTLPIMDTVSFTGNTSVYPSAFTCYYRIHWPLVDDRCICCGRVGGLDTAGRGNKSIAWAWY